MHVKNRERAELARQIEAFIARGGRIERIGNTPHAHAPQFNCGHLERTR